MKCIIKYTMIFLYVIASVVECVWISLEVEDNGIEGKIL